MKIVHNKQIWQGTFTYMDGYDEIDQYTDVSFTMELAFEDNAFEGTSTDVESADIFDKPASVKGFADNDKMSFVLNYPCYYYKNDDGKIVTDESLKHPDIHYLGFFDEDKNSVSGTWEMITYEERHGDYFLEETANGTFEMRRMS